MTEPRIIDAEENEVVYNTKDAPKIMALKVLNNAVSCVFYLALILLAYNCNWCGGPRMW